MLFLALYSPCYGHFFNVHIALVVCSPVLFLLPYTVCSQWFSSCFLNPQPFAVYLRLHAFRAITRAYLVRFIVYDLIHSHPFSVHFPSIALVACAFCYTFSAGVHSSFSLLSLLVTRSRFLYPFTAWLFWVSLRAFPVHPLSVPHDFSRAFPGCSPWLCSCICCVAFL